MADDTEIVLTQEPPATATEVVLDDKAPKPKAAAPAKVVTADEGIEDLRAQVKRAQDESARRLQAKDLEIQAAFRRTQAAEQEAAVVKKDAVSTVIDSLTKDKDAARRDYKLAMEAGDFDKAGEAQERIATAAARIEHAHRGKLDLEEAAKSQPQPLQQRAQPIEDPVEAVARAVGPNSRSAAWFRANPEFARDQRKYRDVERAHFAALGEGHSVESDAYFDFVNDRLGIGHEREVPRETQRDRPSMSAPVSRDAPQAPGAQRPGSVRLTPSQQSAAIDTLSPLYPKASRQELLQMYARNLVELQSEGRVSGGRMAS